MGVGAGRVTAKGARERFVIREVSQPPVVEEGVSYATAQASPMGDFASTDDEC
jgi:hypothetical protein